MHYLESESQASPNLAAATALDLWQNLRRAIAQTSGFQRWQAEQGMATPLTPGEQEAQIDRYLREALATLAY